MYIYKITNKINDKVYIGQTIRSVENDGFNIVAKLEDIELITNFITL